MAQMRSSLAVYVGREQLISTIREKRNTVNQCYRVTRCAIAAAVAAAVE